MTRLNVIEAVTDSSQEQHPMCSQTMFKISG